MKKLVWISALLALAGCFDSVSTEENAAQAASGIIAPPAQPGAVQAGAIPTGAAPPGAPGAKKDDAKTSLQLPYKDEDFVEIDIVNRDPFRSFANAFAAKAAKTVQRKVLLPESSIDELQLIAIISGVARPSAMVKDKAGVGHVIRPGNYVGRPETVSSGADALAVTYNWRVERVIPGEVVLTRPNPAGNDQPPLRRVIVLREDEAQL